MPRRENKQEFMERHVIGQTGRGMQRQEQSQGRAPQSPTGDGDVEATPHRQHGGDQRGSQPTPKRSRADFYAEHAEQSEGRLGNPNSQQI